MYDKLLQETQDKCEAEVREAQEKAKREIEETQSKAQEDIKRTREDCLRQLEEAENQVDEIKRVAQKKEFGLTAQIKNLQTEL